jgi:hypothetical protein
VTASTLTVAVPLQCRRLRFQFFRILAQRVLVCFLNERRYQAPCTCGAFSQFGGALNFMR